MEKKNEAPENSLQEVLKNIILRFWNGSNVKKVFVGKFEILGVCISPY